MMSARGTMTSSTRKRAEAQDAQQHLALLGREGLPVAGRFQFASSSVARSVGAPGQAEPGAQGREPAVRRSFSRLLGCGLAGFGLVAQVDLPLMALGRSW